MSWGKLGSNTKFIVNWEIDGFFAHSVRKSENLFWHFFSHFEPQSFFDIFNSRDFSIFWTLKIFSYFEPLRFFPHFERCTRILMLLHIGAHLHNCFVLVSKELILPIICFVHTFLEIQYHHNFSQKVMFLVNYWWRAFLLLFLRLSEVSSPEKTQKSFSAERFFLGGTKKYFGVVFGVTLIFGFWRLDISKKIRG